MPHFKLCKHPFYASSHDAKSFLSRTYTPLYIQKQGRNFSHTMNYLVVQQHHQKIEMRGHNLMLTQIRATSDVKIHLHIPDVPDIASLTNISTTSTFYITHPPTYEHINRHFLPAN